MDSVYHISQTFIHAGSSLVLDFSGVTLQGLQDESWGLDNVRVEIVSDADQDGVPDCQDNCPTIANPDQADCNSNGTGDVCDIAAGTSQDCQPDDIPDECQIGDGNDCDTNGIPDECDPDFDGDGETDACDEDIDDDGVLNDADACDFTPVGSFVQPDGTLRADLDGDCDVDTVDFSIMQSEFTGPN